MIDFKPMLQEMVENAIHEGLVDGAVLDRCLELAMAARQVDSVARVTRA